MLGRRDGWYLLRRAGLALIERNFRCKHGEIDLIMWDQDVLVFVEVRYRRHIHFGGAAASVDTNKQRRIARTAALYLQRQHHHRPYCRFDVLSITGDRTHTAPHIDWIKQAFDG